MDTYTHSTSTNSASSSSSSPHLKPPPAYRSALHSVRKIPAKSVITKIPIAPMPPVPPKVYKVDPADFREVVQRLTAAPEFQRTRLREVAPPPLSISQPFSGKSSLGGNSGGLSPLGFNLSSPSSFAWCSSVFLSPRTLSSLELEPSAIL